MPTRRAAKGVSLIHRANSPRKRYVVLWSSDCGRKLTPWPFGLRRRLQCPC
jgi:hypothetical protein